MATQILNGKYIITLDELSSIALDAWIAFQPDGTPDQAYRISLTNFIKALPIIPAVAGEYADIAEMIAAQAGQTADVFYEVLDPSDDPDYNDLKDSEIKAVYYHLPGAKTASLSDYNSVAIPKLESDKNAKLGNSLQALTFDIKFRTGEWSSNEATLQTITNALKVSSPQDLLLDALSIKLNADNNPADISRVLFGLDGGLIYEPIDAAKIQSDSDASDVTLNDAYQLLLTITGNQDITNGIANIGLTAKSFSTGAITAFAASGNNRVRATSAAHGLVEGDYVEIVNTANYNELVEIKAVPNLNDFDFTAAFVATETGDWEKSEDREIAVDLRVNAVSAKEFTRQIEGEGRLNFSEQLAGVNNGEDITVYVKSNTLGEAIEILGTSQSSQLKVIDSTDTDSLTEPNTWYVNSGTQGLDTNVGSDKFPFKTIQAAHDAAAEGDILFLQNREYFSTANVTITKSLTLKGSIPANDNDIAAPFISGNWDIAAGKNLMIINVWVRVEFTHASASWILQMTGCHLDSNSLPARKTKLILNDCFWELDPGQDLYSLVMYDTTAIFGSTINIGRSFIIERGSTFQGSIVSGIDSAASCSLKDSSIEGNVTITGNLEKVNAVIAGDETVSGTTTDETQTNQQDSAPTIAATVLDIDFKIKRDYKTTAEVAATADFSITLSNTTNAQIATIDLFITNTVIITLPANSIMEEDDTRWNSGSLELTIAGATGSSIELSLNKVGTKLKWIASQKFS